MAAKPVALVLSGFGLNCERETALAFESAGAEPRIVHLPDLAAAPEQARGSAIIAVPGGFSFGDHLGAGNALASYLEAHLAETLRDHVARGGLMIGICNGCQTLTRLGLLGPDLAVTHNAGQDAASSYECRWVHVAARGDRTSPWLAGIDRLHLPVAHGEGRFVGEALRPALTYVDADGHPAGGRYPANPNGAGADTAGVLDATGRILALMPHPERYLRVEQHPTWTRLREETLRSGAMPPSEGAGLAIFRNAVAAA